MSPAHILCQGRFSSHMGVDAHEIITLARHIARAAVEMGVPASGDFNTGDNEGVGAFHVNQKRGLRWSAAKAFLKPVLGRATLRLETGDTIEKMLADIDVPEADRKEIDEKLRALLKKQKLAVGWKYWPTLSGVTL